MYMISKQSHHAIRKHLDSIFVLLSSLTGCYQGRHNSQNRLGLVFNALCKLVTIYMACYMHEQPSRTAGMGRCIFTEWIKPSISLASAEMSACYTNGLPQVHAGAVPCCMHDSFVLDIAESANADGI